MNGKRLAVVIVALALLALQVGYALADGPVIWKQHCPRWYDVVQVEDKGGDGVHVLCVLADAAEEVER